MKEWILTNINYFGALLFATDDAQLVIKCIIEKLYEVHREAQDEDG